MEISDNLIKALIAHMEEVLPEKYGEEEAKRILEPWLASDNEEEKTQNKEEE